MKSNWMLLIFCALLLLLAAGSVFAAQGGLLPPGYYAALEEVTVLEFSQDAAPAPAPASAPPDAVPAEGAVELVVDGLHICTVESAQAVAAVLNARLASYAQVPAGEELRSVRFTRTLTLSAATQGTEVLTEAAFAAMLAADPALCPVESISAKTVLTPIPYETQEAGKDARIPKGARLVDVGMAGVHLRITEQIALNGVETSSSIVHDADDVPAIAQKVWTGTYQSSRPERAPGRSEGEEGPEREEALSRPIARGSISSNYGTREGRMHYGVDYACDAGAEVLAPAAGRVLFAGVRGAYGGVVDIDHGDGLVSRLARLSDIAVAVGDAVNAGDVVAVVAQPEQKEDAPRLHFETLIQGIPYNPRQYLD